MTIFLLSSSQMRCLLLIVASLQVVSAVGGDGGFAAGAMFRGSSSRKLLQTACPIDFSSLDYTGVTSVCDSINPNVTLCCDALYELACPYAEYINDPSTNCAEIFLTYLLLSGNYSPTVFSNCSNVCPASSPAPLPAPLGTAGGDP